MPVISSTGTGDLTELVRALESILVDEVKRGNSVIQFFPRGLASTQSRYAYTRSLKARKEVPTTARN